MKLIVGLGNPEQKYDGTRHNVGFYVLDRLAAANKLPFTAKSKFKAHVAQGDGWLLVKPTTYYNLVGESARALADFYKIEPHDILIIHDDLALPLGTVRTRIGGRDAGNNGIKSLNQHLGTSTARLRIGTHTEHRGAQDDADFVLDKFSKLEQKLIDTQLPTINTIVANFINGTFTAHTHK